MTEELPELKQRVREELDGISAELRALGERIFENPELKFQEYKAMKWLTEKLDENEFEVEKGTGGLETAFMARCPHNDDTGPTIAYLCEYDALPNLGHACGHNLIASIGLGAGLGLCSEMDNLNGNLLIIGTPAEEGGDGKVTMIENGVFDEVDVAMMVHPSDQTVVDRGSLGIQRLEINFDGKASHAAASPEEGINALDAVIATFNNINSLREHIKESSRIHGIITDGGEKPNIVPEHAAASFYIRTKKLTDLEELVEKVKNCAKAGALATGAQLEMVEAGEVHQPMKSNPILTKLFSKNLESLGEKIEEYTDGLGSTDMGNVSHTVPAIHPYIKIAEKGTAVHTRAFAEAANSDKGYSAMITAAKALAMTGVDLLFNENNLVKVNQEFEGD